MKIIKFIASIFLSATTLPFIGIGFICLQYVKVSNYIQEQLES